MKTSNAPSTSRNTRKPSVQPHFCKGPVGRGEGFYFKMLVASAPQAPRRQLNQPFRLALPAEQPDFTPADQGWMAELTSKPLTWDEW